jgi:lipopolysaccharide/colanic/teichoic acid biosynthesis glycosyltransferase
MQVEIQTAGEESKGASTPAPFRRSIGDPRAADRCLAPLPPSVFGFVKRSLDILLSLALLILTLPLLLLAAVIVKLTSRGPIFYSQTRMGLNGVPFTIYKVRTMYHDCEKTSGARWCRPGDMRVIPLGRFLRRTHLDELPQLWNILRGDMSLIGPRPERPEFLPQLEKALPHYRARLCVRPGLTGLAQVQLPPDTDLNSARKKLAYDLWYVHRRSFWFELRLLIATGLHVIGVPARAIRAVLRLPRPEPIERAYGELIVERPIGSTTPVPGSPWVQVVS